MTKFRFLGIDICDPVSGKALESIPLTEGVNQITAPSRACEELYQALARRRAVAGVIVRSTGDLDPDVPDWIFSPNEDIERTLIAGLAWPPLRSLLDSTIGAKLDLENLGSVIAENLADGYQSEIESQGTKFLRVSGFDVQVSRDGTLSVRDYGTGRSIDTNFHAINDKHRLFVSVNEAVRHVAGEPLDVPVVLPGGRSWMASGWATSGGRAIGQLVTIRDAANG